jgi:hypothetical protein
VGGEHEPAQRLSREHVARAQGARAVADPAAERGGDGADVDAGQLAAAAGLEIGAGEAVDGGAVHLDLRGQSRGVQKKQGQRQGGQRADGVLCVFQEITS